MELNNLKKDFIRYSEWFGYGISPSIFQTIIVLLKSPSYFAIIVHRYGYWVNTYFGTGYKNPLKIILKIFYFILKQLVVYTSKVEILVTADIGPGLFLSNKGNIILGLRQMGSNGTVHHNVTTGQGVEGVTPIFGDNVWIGHDSVVYGVISIGHNTIIESGTILSKSLPGNMVIAGNPCKIQEKNIEAGPYPIAYTDLEV